MGRLPLFLRYRWLYASPVVPIVGIVVIVVGVIVGVLFLRGSTGQPRVGDHWHAAYQIAVCGETLPPLRGPFSGGESDPTPGIHSHGDGLIHIHPNSSDDEGSNANLDRFFGGLEVTFRKGALRLPGGRQFRDGDKCPDGSQGTIRLMVGKAGVGEGQIPTPQQCKDYVPNDRFERFTPQNGDCVRIEFGAAAGPSAGTPSPAPSPAPASPRPSP